MARFVLIDDDPLFGNIMTRFAKARGVDVDYFESMLAFESLGRAGRYDAAIVDYDLGDMTGIDIAEQAQFVFGDVPMVLVSSQQRDRSVPKTWPKSIKGFVRKQAGFDAIYAAAVACLTTCPSMRARRLRA
jgi:DNA-binding response OmpR family regulator